MTPKLSLLLSTVRGDHCYYDHKDWGTLETLVACLNEQTFKDFELVVVDGLRAVRSDGWLGAAKFPVKWIAPINTFWVAARKYALCIYRNTALVHASGELCIHLDDCMLLPTNFTQILWHGWNARRCCVSVVYMNARQQWRYPRTAWGLVRHPGELCSITSFPLEAALTVNGFDLAFDGSRGLEDPDWGVRLWDTGLQFYHLPIPDCFILEQTEHDERAVEPDSIRAISKCCNWAWQTQRVLRSVSVANTADLWTRDWLEKLVAPCQFMDGSKRCLHHGGTQVCAYKDCAFPFERDALQEQLLREPPVLNLKKLRIDAGMHVSV